MPDPGTVIPRRALAAVAAAVLAAHAALLLGLPQNDTAPAPRTQVPALQTRSLTLPPPAPPAPALQPAPAAVATRPAPPRPRPPKPAPAPAEAVLDTPIREHVEPLLPAPPADAVPEAAAGPAEQATVAATAEPPATDPAPAPPAGPPAEPPPRGMQVIAPDGQPLPAATAWPVQLPEPARLSFEVSGQAKGFHYSASADLVWRHDGSRYQARQEVSLFLLGSRSQASEGRITALGLEPARFDDKARKLQTAQLDFAEGRAHFGEGAPDAPIGPGAQDRLSVFLQLSALLAGAPQRYAAGTQIRFITVSARRADHWSFRVGETETLELPAGSIAALRLDKLSQGGDGQQASLWLAPALQYLPVRIRLAQDNGDFADLRLKDRTAP